jgi:NADPH:quinone reductase-like Zn-dependent oxidoreductase
MNAIVVTDEAAGTAGMTLVERPEPPAAINDVIVQIHASGFVPTEMEWLSTWTDRRERDRTPSIRGHEPAGVVTALGYGTTGLSVGQRVFGLADWHRDGTLAEYVAIEARNLIRPRHIRPPASRSSISRACLDASDASGAATFVRVLSRAAGHRLQYGACGRTPFERVAPALSTGSCRLSEGRRSTQR